MISKAPSTSATRSPSSRRVTSGSTTAICRAIATDEHDGLRRPRRHHPRLRHTSRSRGRCFTTTATAASSATRRTTPAEDTGQLTVTYHHNLFARVEVGPAHPFRNRARLQQPLPRRDRCSASRRRWGRRSWSSGTGSTQVDDADPRPRTAIPRRRTARESEQHLSRRGAPTDHDGHDLACRPTRTCPTRPNSASAGRARARASGRATSSP